jgi:hypothetical protein
LQGLLHPLNLALVGLSAGDTVTRLPPAHLLELAHEVFHYVQLEMAPSSEFVEPNIAGHAVYLILQKTESKAEIEIGITRMRRRHVLTIFI